MVGHPCHMHDRPPLGDSLLPNEGLLRSISGGKHSESHVVLPSQCRKGRLSRSLAYWLTGGLPG